MHLKFSSFFMRNHKDKLINRFKFLKKISLIIFGIISESIYINWDSCQAFIKDFGAFYL